MDLTDWLGGPGKRLRSARRRHPALCRSAETLEIRTLLAGTAALGGEVLTLSDGLSADARIRLEKPDKNYGDSSSVRMEGSPTNEAGLIRFDTSGIPPGSTVLSVSLTVNIDNTSDADFEIYRLLKPWAENAVTYEETGLGDSWQVAGALGAADRGTTVLGTVVGTVPGTTTLELNEAGIAVVQSWVDDPSTNFGLILQDYSTSARDKLAFSSRDHANPKHQPSFSITYQATPANRAPLVDAGGDQSILLTETAVLDGTVTDDSLPDPPGGVTSEWSVVSGPGFVTFLDSAAVDTTASFGAAGTYVLQLTADDGELTSFDQVSISVDAPPTNNPPTSLAESYTAFEGGAILADDADGSVGDTSDDGVLANDTDADGDPLTAELVSGPSHGTLVLNGDGTFIYVHNGSESQSDSFAYQANDGSVAGNIVTVEIGITPVNDAPISASESYTVVEGGTLVANDANGTIGDASDDGVLANDTDAEGDALTAALMSGPSHGALVLNTDGTFVYTHDGSGTLTDSFTYRANDGTLDGNLTTVAIHLTPLNDPPVAIDDSYAVSEGGTLENDDTEGGGPNRDNGVLVNDSDPEGDPLTAILVSGPSFGVLTFNADGSFIYTHDGSENFSDSFTYRANDGIVDGNSATVDITINPVNDPPVAVDDSYTVAEGATLTASDADGTAGDASDDGLLVNDSDAEGDPLTALLVSEPAYGTLTLHPDGTFVYTHDGSESFSDSFSYRAHDGTAAGNVAAVEITINPNPVNDAPHVDAGTNSTVLLTQSIDLDGTVSDDGLPNPPAFVTTEWSVLSGPGEVTFDNPAAVDTSASFSAAGTYLLQLAADDGALRAADTVTITVLEMSTVFTVSFQDGQWPGSGYAGTRDSRLRADRPTTNYGENDDLEMDDSPHEAAVMSWDLSSIPAGSLVQSVSITLNVLNDSEDQFGIYEILRPWTESGVTYNQAAPGESWEIAGANGASDRGSETLGTLFAPTLGTVTVQLNAAGVAVVQSWIDDPTTNNGIIIDGYADSSDRLEVDSSEGVIAANRPKFSVTYDVSPLLPLNEAPQVEAGADATVFDTGFVILDGTVTDDNLPVPLEHVTTVWSVVSGPGTVTFADASSIDTWAEFSEAGTYVLRLTADDSALTAFDELTVTVVENTAGQAGVWISHAEILSLPTSGPAWEALLATALAPAETPVIRDQGNDADVQALAKALVGVRINDVALMDEARGLIMSAMGTEIGGNTLALAKNLASYVIAADVIGLSPEQDAQFRAWLQQTLTEELSGRTLQSTHEMRPNNWGTLAGGSRAAVAAYLGDQQELARVAEVFKGWLGDRSSYADFSWGDDLSWHADPDSPIGINPVGAAKDGHSIDGALPDDMRRGDSFQWPPAETGYPWGALQGAAVQAEILMRSGYDAWQWEDRALLRAVNFLNSIGWKAEGDDAWIPWLIDARYGTNIADDPGTDSGKIMAWTAWTHQHAGLPAANQIPMLDAGPDLGTVTSFPTQLQATIYDDGWPDPPAAVTIHWSVVSGPGEVTFSNPAAIDTTATFSAVGTYVLEVSASDGELTAFDEVTVTVDVQPPNSPPQVNAGPDQTLFVFTSAALDGTVHDDGWPAPPAATTTLWSVVSGPGEVFIADPSAQDTSVHFSEPGTYVLRLTADDGEFIDSDDVTLTVNGNVSGDVVDFQDGVTHGGAYAGTSDTTIESKSPDTNLGAADELEMDGSPESAALIRWEIDPELAGREVLAAAITIYVTNISSAIYEIYEMLNPWVESEATWNEYAAGVEWEDPGAKGESDRGSKVLGVLTSSTKGFVTIGLNSAGVEVVQAWFDNPASNNGLIFQDYSEESSNGLDFDSSEVVEPERRPRLIVTLADEDALTAKLPVSTQPAATSAGPPVITGKSTVEPLQVTAAIEVGSETAGEPGHARVLTENADVSTPAATAAWLTDGQLADVADAALLEWEQAAGSDALPPAERIGFAIVDLPGRQLGRAAGNTVLIDVDAAGFGWFVDDSPHDHREFTYSSDADELIARRDGPAAGRFDLRTVLLHELGHIFGFVHEHDGVMQSTLPLGTRRLLDDNSPAAEHESESTELADVDDFFVELIGSDVEMIGDAL